MAKTQKNKATSYHLGTLKAKLAKLRRELLMPSSGGGGPGVGFDVAKTGNARVGFVGFPSGTLWLLVTLIIIVGKSTLMSKLTGTHSEVGAYEFTTLTTVPGVIQHKVLPFSLYLIAGWLALGRKNSNSRFTRYY